MSKATRELSAQEDRSRKLRRAGFWLGTLLIIAGLVYVVVQTSSPDYKAKLQAKVSAPALNATDWTTGNKDAKVVLIEYGDYQCPACAAYDPIVKKVVNEYKDKILFVFRNFPLSQHANALPSAYAAESAGLQGKYWGMNDLLYSRQKNWELLSAPQATAKFASYAQELNLDLAKFNSDKDSLAVKNKVQSDASGGINAGIDHTPTFFINSKQIPNPNTYDEFKSAIDQALAKNS